MVGPAVRAKQDGVELFSGDGKRVSSVSPTLTKLEGASIDLGASDVGRIFSKGWNMNPMTQYLPSTIVTPHQTWMPYLGQVNMLLHILWAVKTFMDAIEEEAGDREGGPTTKPVRLTRFEVVDFNQILPENI